MLSPAMATMLAVVTTDAAVDHAALQRALARRGRRDVRLPDRRRRPLDQRHGARARQRAGRRGRRRTRSPTRSPRCAASLAEQMARDAEGATKFVRVDVVGARIRRRRPRRGPRRREQPARAVLAQRRRPVLGPGALRARRERRVHRSGARRHLLQRRHRVPRRHRVRRTTRAALGDGDGRTRHRDPLRPAASRTARRTMLTTDLSHAYIDENRRTS